MSEPSLRDQLDNAHEASQTILTICLAERLISEGSADSWVFEVYARSLTGIGRYDDAGSALDQAEKLAPPKDIPWIIHRRAVLEKQRGNFEEALDLWKSAHSLKPDEASFLIFAGSLSFRLGRVKDAEEFARRGTTCSEGYREEAWYCLGGYMAAQQRYDEALSCYEKAIAIDPDYELAIGRRDELLKAFPENGGEQGQHLTLGESKAL
ncbi:MAG: tetratricopeptide repeat protein [Verrucomicrobiota bacterium]